MLQSMWSVFWNQRELFLTLLLEHLQISLIAILIALVFGGLVGILISEFKRSAKPTLGVINFLYTIPSISMLGFLIPFSGVGNATAVIALTVYALLPMVRNTYTGLSNVDPAIIEAAKGMGSTRFQILWRVKLPLAMPVIVSGIRSMVTMTIALAGIASFIGAGGLGVAIYRGITTNNSAMTMVGSLLIAMLALLMDFLLGIIEKKISWQTKKKGKSDYIIAAVCIFICAAVLINVFLPAKSKNVIHIATKPMTEQYILGEMMKSEIEQNTDFEVDLTQGVGGGTSNIEPALEKGDYDMYPEYTGTGWNIVLKNEGMYTEDFFDTLQKTYQDQLKLKWAVMLGFNNTYGIAVRSEIAQKYHLKTYSDLAAVSNQVSLGAEYDFFQRQDGYQALCQAYGFQFQRTMDMDIGLKYQALNEGKIDAMIIFTTDGQLSVADAVVLQDDRQFFPSYECGMVVREDTLQKYPQLQTVLDQFKQLISSDDIQKMNYAVETDGKDPKDVADEFLQEHQLLAEGGRS